jgi:hypothetical protein
MSIEVERKISNIPRRLLTALANELISAHEKNHNPTRFSVIVEGERRILLPALQDEVHRIAREVLRNAFQHAIAYKIEAEISYAH